MIVFLTRSNNASDYFLHPALGNLLHHWQAFRWSYLPHPAIDTDRMDPGNYLGSLCAEPIQNRPKNTKGIKRTKVATEYLTKKLSTGYSVSVKKTQHNEEARTTAIGLSRYAYDYLEAALLVDDHIGLKEQYVLVAPIPALYLAGHAIELALKAYLRHHGHTLKQLRNLGHDLHACYRKAKELNIHDIHKPHTAEEGALELLNNLYAAKELEYIRTGMKHFPEFSLVSRFAVTLHNAVANHVGFRETFNIEFHSNIY